MHYVIGDIHGCFDELMKLLEKIESQDSEAQFIFLGDFIDRGPDVIKTLEWFMDNVTVNGKYQSVLGNHEDMILESYKKVKEWFGTDFDKIKFILRVSDEYGFFEELKKTNRLNEEYILNVIDFFKRLPTRKRVTVNTAKGNKLTYLIAHAWDVNNSHIKVEKRRNINLWERQVNGNDYDDNIIVHGHTPTIFYDELELGKAIPGLITYRHNSVNLDGGCVFASSYPWYPCMLCAICLETFQEFYPYTIEERFRMINQDCTQKERSDLIDGYIKKYMIEESQDRKDILEKLRN